MVVDRTLMTAASAKVPAAKVSAENAALTHFADSLAL